MMRSILMLAHDDGGQAARYCAAVAVTRLLKGSLTCLDVVEMPRPLEDFFSRAGAALALSDETYREAANVTRLREKLVGEGITFTIEEVEGSLGRCLKRAAALADLIILNTDLTGRGCPNMIGTVGEVALGSMRPILAVPPDCLKPDLTGRAMVAWDGSSAARQALVAATPLLRRASAVRIVQIDDGSVRADAEEAVLYLSRHGVHADIRKVRDRSHPADRLILWECRTWRAQSCVMGAYGHSRLVEATIGGVTRGVLEGSTIPVLLAH